METEKILKCAIDAGELMLRNGGETNRVEDTMVRILKKYDFAEVDVFVTPTGLFASLIDRDGKSFSLVKRILARTTNLEKIALINNLSRRFVDSTLDIDLAIAEIESIKDKKPYPHIYKCFASAIACAFFSQLFDGSIHDALAAFFTGFILHNVTVKLSGEKLSSSIATVISGAFVALSILSLYKFGIGKNVDKAMIGSLMPLVPGVGLTNAIRDIMVGDYISGTSRIMDAFLVAVCIAVGVGLGFSLFSVLEGGF